MKIKIALISIAILTISTIFLMSCFSQSANTEIKEELQDLEEKVEVKEEVKDKIPEIEKNLIKFALNFNKSMDIINEDSAKASNSIGETTKNITMALLDEIYSFDKEILIASNSLFFIGLEVLDSPKLGNIPEAFLNRVPPSGYMHTPTGGECPLGASVEMQFESFEAITESYISELMAKAIPYEIMSLSNTDPKSVSSFIKSKLTPDNKNLIKTAYWNNEIWGTAGESGLRSLQEDIKSLIDYHFWSNLKEIESMILKTVETTLSQVNYPPITEAYEDSDKQGFIGYPIPEEKYKISRKNIKAEFSGNVTGTVYESSEFSLSAIGEPNFGPINGEGELLLNEPDIGEVKFDAKLEWTSWNSMGAPTEGVVTLTNEEKGYKIEIVTNSDGTKDGKFFIGGEEVGKVTVDIEGHSTYINIEMNSEITIE